MSKVTLVLTVALLLVGVPTMAGDDDGSKTLKALMVKKLENSHRVLEGLALGDFDKIAKHAEELILISKAAEFRVLKTPEYEVYSNDFRRSAQSLVLMAKRKNADGAALAYVELTLTCIKCHSHVRDIRMARSE